MMDFNMYLNTFNQISLLYYSLFNLFFQTKFSEKIGSCVIQWHHFDEKFTELENLEHLRNKAKLCIVYLKKVFHYIFEHAG